MKSKSFSFRVRKAQVLACSVSLIAIGGAGAAPLNVYVSNAQYTTYVDDTSEVDSTEITRTTVSATPPLTDEIYMPTIYDGVTNHVIATADLLSVSDQTYLGRGNASATSQLWFTPAANQTQTIGFNFYALGANGGHPYTSGHATLLDLTASSTVWSYGWELGPTSDNVPWDIYGNTANFTVNTSFDSSHQYELDMTTFSNSADDAEIVSIQLTGLAVPEPSSTGLFLMALAGFPFLRRKVKLLPA
jgi:hypothetical protein